MRHIEENTDSPEMINFCLNCPWVKCWNCLGQFNAFSYNLRRALEENRVEEINLNESRRLLSYGKR